MSRRVLLTGASGFVGRQAIAPLVAAGFEVHAVARRALAGAPGVVWHVADLLDDAAVTALVGGVRPEALLHLAWDVTPGRYWNGPENLDWVAASLHLYREFVQAGGTRAVLAGTCAEYDWSGDGVLDEGAPLAPATLYGAAKLGLHRLLAAAAARDGVALSWGRVFFLYGPHEAPERLVPSVAVPLLRGEAALVGDGRAMRDFMHVADAAAALVAVLCSPHRGTVNIASGQVVAIAQVVATVAARVGRPDLVRMGARPASPGEPAVLSASGRVLAGLGFRPRFGLQDGLADAVGWWRQHAAGPGVMDAQRNC